MISYKHTKQFVMVYIGMMLKQSRSSNKRCPSETSYSLQRTSQQASRVGYWRPNIHQRPRRRWRCDGQLCLGSGAGAEGAWRGFPRWHNHHKTYPSLIPRPCPSSPSLMPRAWQFSSTAISPWLPGCLSHSNHDHFEHCMCFVRMLLCG